MLAGRLGVVVVRAVALMVVQRVLGVLGCGPTPDANVLSAGAAAARSLAPLGLRLSGRRGSCGFWRAIGNAATGVCGRGGSASPGAVVSRPVCDLLVGPH